MKVTQLCLTLYNPWTIQSVEFSRPEYWSGQPFPSPGDLPDPAIKPGFSALQADSLPAEPQGKPYSVSKIFKFMESKSRMVVTPFIFPTFLI